MIAFDNQLIDGTNALSAEVDAFKADLNSGVTTNLAAHVQSVADKVESFEDMFDKRNEVIMGVM